jgi:hypothetical protein
MDISGYFLPLESIGDSKPTKLVLCCRMENIGKHNRKDTNFAVIYDYRSERAHSKNNEAIYVDLLT